MAAKQEEDENYRPYDTLKAIGFTTDEAKGFLTNIETSAKTQLPPEPKKAPDIQVKFSTQKALLRHSRRRNALLMTGGFAFAVWLYVIAVQFLHPDWIYEPFASWLPIRMDYVGEAAFILSFIILVAFALEHARSGEVQGRSKADDNPPETPENKPSRSSHVEPQDKNP